MMMKRKRIAREFQSIDHDVEVHWFLKITRDLNRLKEVLRWNFLAQEYQTPARKEQRTKSNNIRRERFLLTDVFDDITSSDKLIDLSEARRTTTRQKRLSFFHRLFIYFLGVYYAFVVWERYVLHD